MNILNIAEKVKYVFFIGILNTGEMAMKKANPNRINRIEFKHKSEFLTRQINWDNVPNQLQELLSKWENKTLYKLIIALDTIERGSYTREELYPIMLIKKSCFKYTLIKAKELGFIKQYKQYYYFAEFDKLEKLPLVEEETNELGGLN